MNGRQAGWIWNVFAAIVCTVYGAYLAFSAYIRATPTNTAEDSGRTAVWIVAGVSIGVGLVMWGKVIKGYLRGDVWQRPDRVKGEGED